MGASCAGDARGKDGVELPLGLQAPNVYLVIGSQIGLYIGVSALLSFALGPTALVLSALLVILVAMVVVEPFERNYPSTHWMMVLCAATAAFASVCGCSNYHQLYSKHLLATEGRLYNDVSPLAKASAHADGGVIHFSSDAALDDTRAVGLLSFGSTYCVAPIVSREAAVAPHSQGPTVQFWAVGKDCCRKRSSFECDSAGDPDARSGIVLREGEEDVTGSFLAVHMDEPEFFRAVEAATALFELESADEPVLVRWVRDTDTMVKNWWIASILFWLLSCVCHCAVVAGVWCLVHRNYDRKLRDAVEALMPPTTSNYAGSTAVLAPDVSGKRPRKDPFLLGATPGSVGA